MNAYDRWAQWAHRQQAQFQGGQLEIRRLPEGLIRGVITDISTIYDNRVSGAAALKVVIATAWTAIQPAEFPGGLGGPVPTGPWQPAESTADMPEPREFVFYPGAGVERLHWGIEHEGAYGLHYHDYVHDPARQVLITLYPAGHASNIAKP